MAETAARRSEVAARRRREPPSRRAGVRRASLHPAVERLLPQGGQRAGRRVRGPGDRRQPAGGREARTYRRTGIAGAESRTGDGRRRPALRVLLRPGHLVQPGRGARRSGPAGGRSPIIGDGEGVWSWVHIEDAALATVDVLTAPPGVYNVVDDDPLPGRRLAAGVRPIRRVPRLRRGSPRSRRGRRPGEDAVYYGTKLRGASNQKAKRTFGFEPRRLEWLER